MTISSLLSALSQGYNASQIVGWLSNNHKKLSKTIKSALAQGYTQDDVLEYLTKGKYASHSQRNQMLPGQTEAEKGSRIFNQGTDWKGLAKNIATGTALATGAYGALRGLPAISQGLQVLRGASQQPNPPGPTPMGGAPISPTSLNPSGGVSPLANQTQQSPQAAPNIPSPKPIPSPTPSAVNSVQIINDMGIGSQIKSLQQAGNTPEAIAAAIGVSLKPGQRKWLDEQIKAGSAKPLADMIQDYISEPGQRIDAKQTLDQVTPEAKEFIKGQMEAGQEGTLPEMLDKFSKQKKESATMQQIGQDVAQMEKKLEKGSLVGTSDGMVGEVKELRNGKALVEEDGKLHQFDQKDLELPDEEVIQAVEKILNLPEIEKSAVISSLIYRPSQKQMFVKYHNGESYVYEDVDKEAVDPIAEAMGIPITTGQNFYGAWEEGKQDSRGAALIHGILRQAKYARDQEGKTWEKLETKYDRHKKLFKKPKRKRKNT